MKRNPYSEFTYAHRLACTAVGVAALAVSHVHAASNSWVAGVTGDYSVPENWTGGVDVPNSAADTATSDGTGSVINYLSTDNYTLAALNLNVASGATMFNQAGGSLTLNSLGFGGAGGSRNPTYNLDGGTLVTGAFPWGNGNNARFNVNGGAATHNGVGLAVGVAGGANGAITVASGSFSHTGTGQLVLGSASTAVGGILMTGGTFETSSPQFRIGSQSGGTGNITLSGTAIFNGTATGTIYLGNNGGSGNLTLSDTAAFNGANLILSVGQFGNTANNKGTLTMSGSSTLSTSRIVLGGDNAPSSMVGVVNLDGGTISAGSIRLGSSNVAPSLTANVIHANGGTVKATTHANNNGFFNGAFVDLMPGGLKFDTNDNFVSISNIISGTGGLEKLGGGSLTLSGLSTYSGNTTVTAGELVLAAAFLDDSSTLTVDGDAMVNLSHGIEDIVGSLVVDGVTYTSGTVGSFESTAIVQLPQFSGFGKIRIGPPPTGRDLIWTGATSSFWTTLFEDENFTVGGSPTVFQTNDSVTFDDTSAVTTVLLSGNVQAGTLTFNGGQSYTIDGLGSGISGEASIVKNSSGTLTLGGATSNFTGTIAVNAGLLVKADNASFGNSSGITIADGAQVDINGKGSGSIHTYTIGGTGPDGSGTIINTGGDIFSSGGVKNLVLTADSTIGSDGGRFDVGGGGGTITGNGFTLTKIGNSAMAFRGDASGTPIHYVIAGGAAWTENSALGFGGATGTITVKNGARVGNVGNHSIATPVTVESGGRIYSNGGTGTWTGAVTLQGEAIIDGAAGPVIIDGALTGTANLTKTGANNVTLGNIGYTGNTTVDLGALTLAATGLPDDSDVIVDADASIALTHGQQDTIDTLRLGGVPAMAGVWGSADSGAPNTSSLLLGTGTLLVLTTGTTPFDDWAAALPEGQRARESDPDGDGFSNLEEYLFGTDPALNTGSLVQSVESGATLVVTWNQRNADATYQLQERSADLGTAWPASTVIAGDAADQTGVPANYTRKEAVVPIDSGRKFLRVNGTES
jgi:fibronectin-binding autotransporter adhesin